MGTSAGGLGQWQKGGRSPAAAWVLNPRGGKGAGSQEHGFKVAGPGLPVVWGFRSQVSVEAVPPAPPGLLASTSASQNLFVLRRFVEDLCFVQTSHMSSQGWLGTGGSQGLG